MKAKFSLSLIAVCLSFSMLLACSKGSSDAQISSQVQSKIAADSNLSGKQVDVQTQNGVVTLAGNVPTEMARTAAANDAATVSGVKTVINNLQVQPETAEAAPAAVETAPAAAESRAAESPRRESAARHRATSKPESKPRAEAAASSPATETASAPAMAPAAPAASPKPAAVTIPDGTEISIRLADALDSATAQAGDTFRGTLAEAITEGDQTVLPTGADVEGRVVEAKNAAHFSGGSSLTLELTRLTVNGKSYNVQTDQWSKQGTARGKNTAAKVGGGAALGAIIGGIAGGGKGAAIGAGIGAGAGTGVQAATRGQQIRLAPEAVLNFRLTNSLTVTPAEHRTRE